MTHDPHAEPQGDPWWTSAVVYQVYPRSFTDSNGDGIGDLRGVTWRVGYLRELGVDALWLSPWYPSPMVDGGYDVSDYCDIHPDFGSLSDADELIETAHDAGLKVIIDLVANHASAAHPAFAADPATGLGTVHQVPGHPWWDQPALADIQRRWRRIADRYDPPRMFVSEASAPGKLDYLAPDRLHATFIFDQMWAEWTPSSQRHLIPRDVAVWYRTPAEGTQP